MAKCGRTIGRASASRLTKSSSPLSRSSRQPLPDRPTAGSTGRSATGKPMKPQKLFVASCISIGTAALVFAIRGDVAGPMSAAFHITNEQMGLVFSPAFFAFTLAIFLSGNLVDVVGMRALHALSALGFIIGVGLVILAPHPSEAVVSLFDNAGTTMLFVGFFLMGFSHGLVEGVINPLIATIYSTEKTKKII